MTGPTSQLRGDPPPIEPADPNQLALMTELLEGADPQAYIVMPVGAFSTQVLVIAEELRRTRGKLEPGRFAFRFVRVLLDLGFVVKPAERTES